MPIGLASLALVHWLVDEPEVLERERAERLAGGLKVDWVGFVLIALTLGCLEVVLDRGQIDDWFDSDLIITFATLAAISFLAFIPWEISQDEPIVELRLLFHRQFGMAFFVMLMIGAILFGSNQIMPQLLQTTFPYTAMLSGLAMMPGGLAMLLIMPIAGVGHRPLSAEIPDGAGTDRHRAVDVVLDVADARCELRLLRLGARLSDDRAAVPVHSDQYRGL